MSKVAVVTGGTSGIGRATALALKDAGYTVYELSRRAEGVEGLHHISADVTDQQAVNDAVAQIMAAEGHIDVLVNNAGVAGQALFQDITPELWRRYFSINVDGAFHTIQAVLPRMLHHHQGCIVNISSIWGQRGASCEVAYACTKAGIIALTRSLAMELAPSGIRVNCVAPGVIETDMMASFTDEDRAALAED